MSGNIMNASVMGMNAQTSWLATISQNISNSSTTGYKNAETEFTSLVDQSAPGNYSAGGVATQAISMNSQQGSVVGTSTTTDMAVQGAGFFVVSDAAGDTWQERRLEDGSSHRVLKNFPTAEELRRMDISIGPTGEELPPGRGTVKEGAQLFAQK